MPLVRLAIFDLDGTIARHDTLTPYVLGYLTRRRPWRLPALVLALPALLVFALGRRDRGRLKSAFIRAALGGCRRDSLTRWTGRFVSQLCAHGVFAQALAAIEAHARAGDHLVLMSASIDLYVPAIGQALGFAETLCTGVSWRGERLKGTLSTANLRGIEKAHCLTALRKRHPGVQATAYGNAASDIEHLCQVERGVLVNGSAAARAEAVRAGISCTVWH